MATPYADPALLVATVNFPFDASVRPGKICIFITKCNHCGVW